MKSRSGLNGKNTYMMDAHSVITHAAEGHVKQMAAEMEVSVQRMYEMLGNQCTYPKAKRLIRVIGKFNPAGVAEIRSDIDAMFDDILGSTETRDVSAVELHKEAFEAIDAVLQGKSAVDQKRELRELLTVVQMKIEGIERLEARQALKAV